MKHCDRLVRSKHAKHGDRLHRAAYTNSKMLAGRLLHYFSPPVGNSESEAWCGWHNDNSVITGLVPAMWLYEDSGEELAASAVSSSGGLHVRGRDRAILRVALPADCLGFQIGEAAQILSGGCLVATPHQVRSHSRKEGERPICRETFALFIEPQWDAAIAPPEGVGYDAAPRCRFQGTRTWLRDVGTSSQAAETIKTRRCSSRNWAILLERGLSEVLKEEETELIPPLSKRLKRAPPDESPVVFGQYLADSFQETLGEELD